MPQRDHRERLALAELAVAIADIVAEAGANVREPATRARVLAAVRHELVGLSVGERATPVPRTDPWRPRPGARHRVSIAWWPLIEGTANLDATSPCFAATGSGSGTAAEMTTIIAVWPTDEQGTIVRQQLQEGAVEVVPWVLSAPNHQVIAEQHTMFPLGQHDVGVELVTAAARGRRRSPPPGSLLLWPFRDNMLRHCVERGHPLGARIVRQAAACASSLTDRLES
jgi:hypothetical protein